MRVSTLTAIVAIPLVAAVAVDHRPHIAALRRRELEERNPGIVADVLDSAADALGLGGASAAGDTSSKAVATPSATTTHLVGSPATVAPSASASAASVSHQASSASVKPSASSSTAASSSSAAAPSSTTSSATPSSEAPPSTTSTVPETSTTHSPEPTSEAPAPTSMAQSSYAEVVTSTDGTLVVTKTVFSNSSESASAESASANSKNDSSGLSKGSIVAIAVIASLVGVGVLVAIALMCLRKRRSDDEPMRWPELNRHGDAPAHHAVPVSRSDGHGSDRRMSLSDELDEPTYLGDVTPSHVPALNGSSFGNNAMLDYDEKAGVPTGTVSFDPSYGHHHMQQQPHQGYGFDDQHSDYTSYPPPVQPGPSPVHGAPYDQWERTSDGAYSSENGYAGMTRQHSPTAMAGVGANAMTFPQPQAPGHHQNY